MKEVHADLLLIQPKPAFKAFLRAMAKSEKNTALMQSIDEAPDRALQLNSVTFIIPEFDDSDQLVNFIADNYKKLFAASLLNWTNDRSLWPEEPSYTQFLEWFQPELVTEVVNMNTNH